MLLTPFDALSKRKREDCNDLIGEAILEVLPSRRLDRGFGCFLDGIRAGKHNAEARLDSRSGLLACARHERNRRSLSPGAARRWGWIRPIVAPSIGIIAHAAFNERAAARPADRARAPGIVRSQYRDTVLPE